MLRVVVVLLWIGGIALGFDSLRRYGGTPGVRAEVSSRWPASAPIGRSDDLPTLLVFVHPLCPCTHATIAELAKLVTWCEGDLHVLVVILDLPYGGTRGKDTSIESDVRKIPGVEVRGDPSGEIARTFGARTSGECFLYSPEGALMFTGGITSARGHRGDNAGEESVAALVHGGRPTVRRTPVFGCALFDAEPGSAGP